MGIDELPMNKAVQRNLLVIGGYNFFKNRKKGSRVFFLMVNHAEITVPLGILAGKCNEFAAF